MPPSPTTHPDRRFEALAESAPDAILTIDERGTILFANQAAERLLGYRPDELVGTPLDRIIPERLRARHDAGMARYLRTGRRSIDWSGVELAARHRDGHEIPVEISFGEFTDEGGRQVFSGFLRDVSERERTRRELEAARADSDRALRELSRLSRITDAALAATTYDEMVDALLRSLRDTLEADVATLHLLDRAGQTLEAHAAVGEGLEGDEEVRVPLGRGVTGRVAETGQPLVLDDLAGHEVVSAVLRERIASLAAVPVHAEGRVIGVLRVGARARRHFVDADVRLLQVVAERMAGVLARTRLFEAERAAREQAEAARRALLDREERLRRANAELEARARDERAMRTLAQSITGAVRIPEVMHQISEGALGVSGASGAFVEQVVSPDGAVEVVAGAGAQVPPIGQRVPYPGSLTEEMIERREPVFLARMQGLGAAMAPYLAEHCAGCSVLVVPLLAESSTLGALVLLRRAGEPAFDPGVVARVRTLGDLASMALQRLVALAESERRRSEAEAAVRSRDEVLSIVSHDLRNPVSTVTMSASLLADPEIPLTEEQRRTQVAVIARSAQRMNRLIQDLLDVARIEGGRLTISCRCEEAGSLVTEACEAFRPIAREKGLELTCRADPALPRVLVDRDRMLQILSNFLNNAIKFTPAGGRVTVEGSVADDGGAHLCVTDTGPGIPAEELPHVFTRFWQARRTAHMGSGLGLAIARGIAEAHRGRVWVESAPGRGSAFHVAVPPARECA